MKKHRVFVAIPVSKTLQTVIAAWRKPFNDLPVRWIAPENLHITLIPPWYTADIDTTIKLLKTLAGAKAFAGTLTEVAPGPDPRRPRLVWATGETPQELLRLKKRLETTLKRVPEHHPLRFHLTLGRLPTIASSTTAIQTIRRGVSWRETFSSFVLMESHLSPRGATYTTITAFPFTSSSAASTATGPEAPGQ